MKNQYRYLYYAIKLQDMAQQNTNLKNKLFLHQLAKNLIQVDGNNLPNDKINLFLNEETLFMPKIHAYVAIFFQNKIFLSSKNGFLELPDYWLCSSLPIKNDVENQILQERKLKIDVKFVLSCMNVDVSSPYQIYEMILYALLNQDSAIPFLYSKEDIENQKDIHISNKIQDCFNANQLQKDWKIKWI